MNKRKQTANNSTFTPAQRRRLDALTEADIETAAADDADNPALTDENEHQTIEIINPRTIRKKLNMTQATFAKTYRLNLRTLQDWEQVRTIPDRGTLIYLRMIYYFADEVKSLMEKSLMAH
jgi:DNA-binding transcriptional regulator YiaG